MKTFEELLLDWALEFESSGRKLEADQAREGIRYIEDILSSENEYREALKRVLFSPAEQSKKIAKKTLGYK